jgi:hypothetical protein
MESSFDHDFSRVRIHDDTQAASSARAVNALAYTVGRNVVFAAGKYAPGTKDGRRLLAHELVHVVQQGSASPSSDIVVGGSGSAHEEEADRVASRMASGRPATIRQEETPTLQRQVSDGSGGACVTREDIPANVGPLINAGGQVRQRFDMNIDWMNSPDEIRQAGGSYCDCACGEYRQYVKGHLIINGNPESFPLWGGAVLEEDVYHEDAIDRDPDKRYGHRDEPQKNSDKFLADRMSGCSYRGKDAPGVFIGSDIDVLFHFKGQTYDVCNDIYGPFHEWEFRFKGTLNR